MAFVSETWLSTQTILKFSGYNVVRADRDDSYGGLCAIIHRSIKFSHRPNNVTNSQMQVMIIEIFNIPGLKHIISIYCPPSVTTNQHDWDSIFSFGKSECLIFGDMNAHHALWSCKSDRRGEAIYKAMFENHFVCLNDGSHTRIKWVNGSLQKSSPDISFASTDIATNVRWQTCNENLGSDHVILKMTYGYIRSKMFTKKRNYKEANWAEYNKEAEIVFDISVSDNVQTNYDLFMKSIQSLADKHIPWIKTSADPSSKFRPKHYWNSEISKAVAERRLALAKVRRNPTPSNLSCWQTKVSKANELIKKASSKAWKDFCTSIDHESSATIMWRKMRWMKGNSGGRAGVDPDNARNLLHSLTPDSVAELVPSFCSVQSSVLEIPITLPELLNCLKKKDTSPGVDNISYSMIFNLSNNGKLMLLKIFNLIIQTGVVPDQWRDVQIVPILKPGRDPSLPSSLHPISLMSCPCKILHLILMKRIEWFVESQGLLPGSSTGFRRSQSCLDNLAILTSDIQQGFGNKQPTVACFIDIDNAYNNINIRSLINILQNISIGNKICKYLWNFLSDRRCRIFLNCGGSPLIRHTHQGLAQGDPISPLLFNIATMEIGNSINNVCILQYADDFVLYKTVERGRTSDTVNVLQFSIDSLIGCLEKVSLYISETKSKVCVFKRSRKDVNVNIVVNGNSLEVVRRVKYLGLWLDSPLRWGLHVKELCERNYKHINLLKVLAGRSWGVHPKHLRRLYLSLIRSRLDYGSFIYGNCAICHLKKIDILQNRALRVCGGFIRSTPIIAMESELSIPPLAVRRYWLGCRFLLRIRSRSNSPIISALQSILTKRNLFTDKKISLLANIYEEWKDLPVYHCDKLGMYSLNTWVSSVDSRSYIMDSIDYIDVPKRHQQNEELRNSTLRFFTEQYIQFYKIYTYEALQLIHEFTCNDKVVQIQWIPSNVGLVGNEAVDKLAKTAVMGGSVLDSIPYTSEVIPRIKKRCLQKWEYHFGEQSLSRDVGIWYRTIQARPLWIPWFDSANLARKELVSAFRVRSGHIPTNKFLCMMGVKPSPLCVDCQKPDDLSHVLLDCVRNSDLRKRIFSCLGSMHNGQINCWLAEPLSDIAISVYHFIDLSLT